MQVKHDSMRGHFAAALHEEMAHNENIILITADLGWGMWNDIQADFPNRFLNVGAAEQVMLGIGIGLALENKIPFCYSITPFLLYRPFEWIRNYVNHEQVPVRLVGSGLDYDYEHDGITHHADDARKALDLWPKIIKYFPEDKRVMPAVLRHMIDFNLPSFLCLRR